MGKNDAPVVVGLTDERRIGTISLITAVQNGMNFRFLPV
jgi:hypothetical protein